MPNDPADSNKLINMTDTWCKGEGKGSKSHGTSRPRGIPSFPGSHLPISKLSNVYGRAWKTGCIMHRRLSFFLSGVIFRREKFERVSRRRRHWIHGNGARAISPRVLSRVVKRREHRHYRRSRRIGGER